MIVKSVLETKIMKDCVKTWEFLIYSWAYQETTTDGTVAYNRKEVNYFLLFFIKTPYVRVQVSFS